VSEVAEARGGIWINISILNVKNVVSFPGVILLESKKAWY